jgi:hypothetical protein
VMAYTSVPVCDAGELVASAHVSIAPLVGIVARLHSCEENLLPYTTPATTRKRKVDSLAIFLMACYNVVTLEDVKGAVDLLGLW